MPGRQARKRPMLLIRKRVQWHQAAEVAARDPGRVRAEVRARAVARFRARAVAVVPAEDTEPEAVVPAEVLAEAVPVKAPVAGPDQAVAKGAAEAAEEKNGAGRLSALIKPADSLLLIK